jgi:hypothetical protein
MRDGSYDMYHDRFEPAGSEPADVAVLLDATARLRVMRRELGTRATAGTGQERSKKAARASSLTVSGHAAMALKATNPTPFRRWQRRLRPCQRDPGDGWPHGTASFVQSC